MDVRLLEGPAEVWKLDWESFVTSKLKSAFAHISPGSHISFLEYCIYLQFSDGGAEAPGLIHTSNKQLTWDSNQISRFSWAKVPAPLPANLLRELRKVLAPLWACFPHIVNEWKSSQAL